MSFIHFARACGLSIDPSKFFPSDKIRRCGTLEKPRSLNGAYTWDGERGWVMDWSQGGRVQWYSESKPWTPEEKALWARKRVLAAKEQDRRYHEAAERAKTHLRAAELSTHGYLTRKGFPEERGLVRDEVLMIPMRDVQEHRVVGYQAIRWTGSEWEKRMLSGMRAKGAVLVMGNRAQPEKWLVEGYATGLSLRSALRSIGIPASVVVCFSAHNLAYVADQIGGQRYVFADNDLSGTGEKVARETGLPYTMSDEAGWDANDLHLNKGLFAVAHKIMRLR